MNLKGRKFENSRLDMEIFVYEIEGKEWFIGKDVAELLGYPNPSTAVSENIKPSQRKSMYVRTIENIGISEKPNSEIITINNNRSFITEIGLYQLVMKSRKPEAEEFQKWIYEEVLPSLRKNNFYIDKENITESQAEKLKIYLFDLCDMGKISLGKASELIFGNKKELKERLVKLGWLDYENCTFIQQKFKATNDKVYELFVTNISSTYEKGVVKSQMQMSITNAGYIYLKNLFEKYPELGKAGEL